MSDTESRSVTTAGGRRPWWRMIGPGLITACVVFGPGSLLISANIGATFGYDMLWLLVSTAILMATYISMGARIGVVGQATPCQLIASRLGRVAAAVVGINLCLICTSFQFSNNLAVVAAADALGLASLFDDPAPQVEDPDNLVNGENAAEVEVPPIRPLPRDRRNLANSVVLVAFNGLIILMLFLLRQVYRMLERVMKVMVAVILVSFAINLVLVGPNLLEIIGGLIPSRPAEISFSLQSGALILVASLLGTTFSVAGAFFQGNLVRERGWKLEDYNSGIGDSLTGVAVLAFVSGMIMLTSGTVLRGQPATNIAVLATQLQPLLGPAAHTIFCVGLFAVAMNPFVINAMIGGAALADGLGKAPRLSDPWPRRFTVMVLLIGMSVALLVIHTPVKFVDAIIFGQAMTVLGNPLMAASMIWLANRRDIMGERRNGLGMNILAGAGFLVVLGMAILMFVRLVDRLTAA